MIGGRVGYVIFYNFDLFLADPLYLFKVWTGGMSFHGGLLGVITAMFWYARKTNAPSLVWPILLPLGAIRFGDGTYR